MANDKTVVYVGLAVTVFSILLDVIILGAVSRFGESSLQQVTFFRKVWQNENIISAEPDPCDDVCRPHWHKRSFELC